MVLFRAQRIQGPSTRSILVALGSLASGGFREEGRRGMHRESRPRLPGAAHAVFEGAELLYADRTTGVEPAGGDADLGAEAEFATIRELGRGVVEHDRGVDLVEEPD